MVSKRSRLIALVLAVITLLSVVAVGTFGASAAAGDTVYCENAKNWSSVYCYMWKEGSEDNNSKWPGVQMTKGEGNLWSYKVTGDWDMVIFNGGEGQEQTENLAYKGNGSCYNTETKQWTTVDTPDVPDDPKPTTPTNPVNPTPTPSGGNTVYFKNTANWSKVNVYMWNGDGTDKNADWPGVAAKDMGEGVWMYEAPKDWKMVIFNDGSTQTDNLEFKGSDYIYDYGKNAWELYDTSKLHIKSFTADATSPQYTGVKINLTAVAGGGEGDLSYKFSAGNTVISDFSSASTASWTPATAGKYTVTLEVKDTAGATATKEMSFEIKDIKTAVEPVIQSMEVSPSNFENTEIKKDTETTIDVTAGGGNTGTNLLFYKYTITDTSGETVNVPYYTLKNQYKFTPASTGTYSVTATVQGSDNSITAKTIEYDSVTEFSKPGALTASLSHKDAGDNKFTFTVTAAGGEAPYTYEFKLNGASVQAASDKNTYTLTATGEGNYTVEVIVKDAAGATVTKTDSVQIGSGNVEPTPEELKATLVMEDQGDGSYKFTVTAQGGKAPYEYQFTANGAVVKEYSSSNTATLKMTADGTYTIKVTVKDSTGTTAEDQKVIKISGGKLDMPLEVTLTIAEDGEYLKATANAIGGEGEYLYEFLIDGNVQREYNKSNSFVFGLGKTEGYVYSISVNVKDAAGTVVTDDMDAWVEDGKYCYGEYKEPEVTDPDLGEYLKGDTDCSGKVNVKDATLIQKYIAKITDIDAQGKVNGEVDGNGKLNVKDATMIQKYLAKIIEW